MKEAIIKILDGNNYRLINLFEELGIKRINLISCGNSIATGYTKISFTKPLLLRNENIDKIALEKGIKIEKYHFSRPRDNNDEYIYSWLINDVPYLSFTN